MPSSSLDPHHKIKKKVLTSATRRTPEHLPAAKWSHSKGAWVQVNLKVTGYCLECWDASKSEWHMCILKLARRYLKFQFEMDIETKEP